MRASTACFVALGLLAGGRAWAGTSFLSSDGVNRAPASVLHCVGPGNIAIPCGTAAQPLYVTSGSSAATAANQSLEVQADQGIAGAIGTQQDAAYAGGAGSAVSLLKGIIATLANGVTALPSGGTLVSRSVTLVAQQSTALFPANAARHYLGFQAPAGTSVWVNFLGGVASPGGADCAQLSAGTLYESGPFVTRGAVTIYAPVAVSVSAWEG
jgi:hypothetical protein